MGDADPKLEAALAWLRRRNVQCSLDYNTQNQYYVPAYLRSKRKADFPPVLSFWQFLEAQGWRVSSAACAILYCVGIEGIS